MFGTVVDPLRNLDVSVFHISKLVRVPVKVYTKDGKRMIALRHMAIKSNRVAISKYCGPFMLLAC